MRVVLIGTSGMVGQGNLRACLKSSDVAKVIVIPRRALAGFPDPRLSMSEAAYRAVTCDLTLHVEQRLLARSPGMTMVYVSVAGPDSTGQSKTMWARIRGQTANALLQLPFQRVVIFRPAFIVPVLSPNRPTSSRMPQRALMGCLRPSTSDWYRRGGSPTNGLTAAAVTLYPLLHSVIEASSTERSNDVGLRFAAFGCRPIRQ